MVRKVSTKYRQYIWKRYRVDAFEGKITEQEYKIKKPKQGKISLGRCDQPPYTKRQKLVGKVPIYNYHEKILHRQEIFTIDVMKYFGRNKNQTKQSNNIQNTMPTRERLQIRKHSAGRVNGSKFINSSTKIKVED